MNDTEYLAHYGVKGMKWGVRKDRGAKGINAVSPWQNRGVGQSKTSASKQYTNSSNKSGGFQVSPNGRMFTGKSMNGVVGGGDPTQGSSGGGKFGGGSENELNKEALQLLEDIKNGKKKPSELTAWEQKLVKRFEDKIALKTEIGGNTMIAGPKESMEGYNRLKNYEGIKDRVNKTFETAQSVTKDHLEQKKKKKRVFTTPQIQNLKLKFTTPEVHHMDQTAYLAHYGVKGMKWGVRHERRKGARQYQKQLRGLDKDLRAATINQANSSRLAGYYSNRMAKQALKGNYKKAADATEKVNRALAITRDVQKTREAKAQELFDILAKAEKEGYSWKATPTNFNDINPRVVKQGRELMKQHGKIPMNSIKDPGFWYDPYHEYVNASSGNRFTVRDSSSISEKKAERWKQTKHGLKAYRPEKVTYS